MAESLTSPGYIELVVHVGEPESRRLRLDLVPADGQVSVRAHDTGVSNWQILHSNVNSTLFGAFLAKLRAALALPGGDCGTHGFWVERAVIDLPLTSGHLRDSVELAEGFSSEPVAQSVIDFLDEAGRTPGAKGSSWHSIRRRSRARHVVIVGALAFVIILGLVVALRYSS